MLDTSTSFGPARALTRAPMCTAMPPMSFAADLALTGVQPGPHLDAERLHRVADRHRAADGSLWAVEHREEAVSRCVHLAAQKGGELRPDDSVVRIEQRMPVMVAHFGGPARASPRSGRVEMSLHMAKLRELADEFGYWPATTDETNGRAPPR